MKQVSPAMDGLRALRAEERTPPNRRLPAFGIAFVLVAAAGLGYTFLRTPQYRADARVEISLAEGLEPRAAPAKASAAANQGQERSPAGGTFLGELELLTSRPLLAQLHTRMKAAGLADSAPGVDPVAALQRMIAVAPVSGTQVVQLSAVGEKPELLAVALNGLLEIYQSEVTERYRHSSDEMLTQAKEEARRFELAVMQKRAAMSTFRTRHNIVSLEREENEALSQVRGLGASLNAAEEKAIAAEARLRSLTDSVGGGKAPVRARDNPTLAGLEARLSQAREEYRQLERSFTEDYLAKDPNARTLKTRIAELEAQVGRERTTSRQASLAEAEEEAARTRETVDRLKARLARDRQSVQAFSARFSEYKALQEEVTNLEELLRGANERAVRLEASERARSPQVRVIEPAATPTEPWRPVYLRDSAITLGAAVVLGFLAAWLTAFLTRREGGPSVVVAPTAVAYPFGPFTMAATHPALEGDFSAGALASTAVPLQLSGAASMPRELNDHEVAALLQAADDRARFVVALLLSGMSPEELLPLNWSEADVDTKSLRIALTAPRDFALSAELVSLLSAVHEGRDGAGVAPIVPAAGGSTPSVADLETLVACAAHDAGLEQAGEITPTALRHTYLAFMARQGVRFSDLAKLVGPLSANAMALYGAMAPVGSRRSLDQIECVLPGLRRWVEEARGSRRPAAT